MNENKTSDGSDFTTTIHCDTYPAIDPLRLPVVQRRRCVFVTGASKGIGQRTAIAFAEAGASHIAIGARSNLDDVEAAILQGAAKGEHLPPQVLKIKLDVTDQESIESAAAGVLRAFGGLDFLINNAGYLETFVPISDSDTSEWWRTWEMNMRSIYLCTKMFLPVLLKGGEKTIINIGSIGAHHFMPGGSAYQTSKLALMRFTEFTMVDHGHEGILAYAVHPGGIPTEVSQRMPGNITSKVLIDTAELASDTIVWLSRERREWLAGRYISCTWDMPELEAARAEIVSGDKLKLRMVV